MSWSVSAVGRASAVASKLAGDFANSKCSEPEETIKNTVASAVASALSAFPPNTPVRVAASGSQSQPDHAKPEKVNQLTVSIEPLWNFLE
jgi:hypothetical protein